MSTDTLPFFGLNSILCKTHECDMNYLSSPEIKLEAFILLTSVTSCLHRSVFMHMSVISSVCLYAILKHPSAQIYHLVHTCSDRGSCHLKKKTSLNWNIRNFVLKNALVYIRATFIKEKFEPELLSLPVYLKFRKLYYFKV